MLCHTICWKSLVIISVTCYINPLFEFDITFCFLDHRWRETWSSWRNTVCRNAHRSSKVDTIFIKSVTFFINWSCRLVMCYIFVFRSFFYINKAVSFLVRFGFGFFGHFGAFSSWLWCMGFVHRWRPYGDI